MKNFVFVLNGRYEAVYSTNQKQAEKDMGTACVAAFSSTRDAELFCDLKNKE